MSFLPLMRALCSLILRITFGLLSINPAHAATPDGRLQQIYNSAPDNASSCLHAHPPALRQRH